MATAFWLVIGDAGGEREIFHSLHSVPDSAHRTVEQLDATDGRFWADWRVEKREGDDELRKALRLVAA